LEVGDAAGDEKLWKAVERPEAGAAAAAPGAKLWKAAEAGEAAAEEEEEKKKVSAPGAEEPKVLDEAGGGAGDVLNTSFRGAKNVSVRGFC
jgi:dihydroxyacetone kinase